MPVKYGTKPFQEQVDFFRRKLNIGTRGWTDLWQGQHDHAFMVAGAMKADLVQDLRQAVRKAIDQGTTLAAFRQDFDAIVQRHGWGYQGGRNWRTRVIFETNLRTSYQAGRYKQMKDIAQRRPYWRYRHSPFVKTPRPEHQAWDGLILRHDDPWWDTHYPPNGWGCFPGDTPVRCDARLGQRFFYSGKMVQIETRLGHSLRLTPNHPVLTINGWVCADKIQTGDQVLGAELDVNATMVGIVNNPEPPTSAKNLFEALSLQGLRIVPMSPDDFHGDALNGKGEVEISGPDSALMDVIQPEASKCVGKIGFQGALHGGIEAAADAVCAADVVAVPTDSVFSEYAANRGLGNSESRSDHALADNSCAVDRQNLSLGVGVPVVSSLPRFAKHPFSFPGSLDGFPSDSHLFTRRADGYAVEPQQSIDSGPGTSNLFSELLYTNAGLVSLDYVVGITEFEWSGHVFDFTTISGLIVAGGMVVSNCRCSVDTLAERDMRKLGKDGPDQAPPIEWETRTVGKRSAVQRTVEVPKGIDPGWAYAPGQKYTQLLEASAAKSGAMEFELGVLYVLGIVASEAFLNWYETPIGNFPIARLPDAQAEQIGANARYVVLSTDTAGKQKHRHPEISAEDYRLVQQAVMDGERIPDGSGMIYIYTVGDMVVVIKATRTGNALYLTSLRKLSADEAKRSREIERLRRKKQDG